MVVLMEILFEFLLQLVVELVWAMGLRVFQAPFQRESSPWLALLGYLAMGAVAGGLSLLVMPTLAIGSPLMQHVNLVVTPLLAGGVMALLGRWRERHGRAVVRLDRFLYGVVFAFSMGAVRYLSAH